MDFGPRFLHLRNRPSARPACARDTSPCCNGDFVLDPAEDIAVAQATFYPDVGVATRDRPTDHEGSVAVLTAPLRLETTIPVPTPLPYWTLEIRDVAQRQLVTVLEVLSPSNKRRGDGDEYITRRQEYLRSSAHLMEIDLLRAGHRVPMRQPLPAAPYFVLLVARSSGP